jgi:phage tail sheath protein FI
LNRLTHAERDTLYENKVNPIAQFPGEGIVAFGQKTLQDRASALDRINVRRLLIKVKKYIASTSRYLVFEQNTSQTRSRFLNTVNPYLEGIQQRQGLFAFRVVMDETNNTPDVIDRNILAGQIFLQPTRTAEFIVLDFNILPTGASFSS